jgi:biotin carboxyl carrier protein
VVEPLGNGRYRVGGRLAFGVAERSRTWVFIDGRTYVLDMQDRDAPERVHITDDQVALSAPMPATVLKINVAPGQDVAEGDVLVLLEAMKMEVPIKAPRAGRVKSLACREGELVQSGVRLLELDPGDDPHR